MAVGTHPDVPIVDHHCHLSPSGEAREAVQRFERAGGTHLFLATQNYSAEPPISLDDYSRQFETTAELARVAMAATRVKIHLVLAPYPVDLLAAGKRIGLERAIELQHEALDLAGTWIRDGRAVALGEVGRPHFPVTEAEEGAARSVFEAALAIAKEVGCPAVIHSEDLDDAGFRKLGELADRVSLPRNRLVKHFAREVLPPERRAGIAASYVARRGVLEATASHASPWFLETDFLDDPKRPGAVLDLATVPRRVRDFLARDPVRADELAGRIEESFQQVYGVDVTTAPKEP